MTTNVMLEIWPAAWLWDTAGPRKSILTSPTNTLVRLLGSFNLLAKTINHEIVLCHLSWSQLIYQTMFVHCQTSEPESCTVDTSDLTSKHYTGSRELSYKHCWRSTSVTLLTIGLTYIWIILRFLMSFIIYHPYSVAAL